VKNTKNEKDFASIVVAVFEWITVGLLSFMVLLVFTNAVLRYTINVAITESEELARFIFIYIIFLGSIIAFKEKKFIAITIVADALKGKARIAVMIIKEVLVFIAIVYLLYSGIIFTMQASTYSAQGFRINFGLVTMVLPIMAAGMLIIMVRDIIHTVRTRKTEGK